MNHSGKEPNQILIDHIDAFEQLPSGPILDLACGHGRHGLYLAERGHCVWFADRNRDALAAVELQLQQQQLAGVIWPTDLESGENPFVGRQFAAVIGVNYLHRPVLAWLGDAIKPGGLIVYETFTTENAQLGRPRNPDFLLNSNELANTFASWQQIHYREGRHSNPDRYSAQLVARKPS